MPPEHKQLEELSNQLSKLQMDLRTVNQEQQATQNQYLINNVVKKMSLHYQEEYGKVSAVKKSVPGETQWKTLTDFLAGTVNRIETHTGSSTPSLPTPRGSASMLTTSRLLPRRRRYGRGGTGLASVPSAKVSTPTRLPLGLNGHLTGYLAVTSSRRCLWRKEQ